MMDRGIPTEEVPAEMRDPPPEMFYLVGTPRGKIQPYQKQWLELPWRKVRDSVEVKLLARDGELYVLAKSQGRRAKESAMRRRKLVRLLRKLKITLPGAGQQVTPQNFTFRLDKVKLKHAELRDGHDLLRTNLTGEDPAVWWDHSIQLTPMEAAFQCLKSELGIGPMGHPLEHRVEAHILAALLRYCLMVTRKNRLLVHAPGLTPRAVLDKRATIEMLDVWFPTTDGRWLVMPRHTEPEPDQARLLDQLKLTLPQQPPPRIKPAVSTPPAALRL